MRSNIDSRKLISSRQLTPITYAVGCVLSIFSGNVFAAELDNEQEAEETKDNNLVVVGSRIRRDGFDNAEPIEIIQAEDAIKQGFNSLGALLRSTTIASGSNQVTSATSSQFVQNGGQGAETLSLRGLGANRTLVLLNGRRAGAAGTQGGVSSFDLNVIPLSAIERVDILKDGASSLYGSDAVAGVVNIITKKVDGGNIDFFASAPQDSGGEQYRFSGNWGKTFEKGNFMITADYSNEAELAKGDRKFFDCAARYIFDPNTGERVDPIDPRTGKAHCNDLLWGHVWIYDYQGVDGNVPRGALAQYNYDGDDLQDLLPAFGVDPNDPNFLVAPNGWFPVAYDRISDGASNADHPFQDETSLIPEVEKVTIFAQGEYEFGDNATGYAEILMNRRTTKVNGYRQFWSYTYNENFNPFAGGFIGAGNSLATGWTGAQWFSPTAITDINDNKVTVDYKRFVAGLTGDIGNSSWYYDASVQVSRSDGDYQQDVIFSDSIATTFFTDGSCVGTVTAVRGVPCVDIPWLDPQFLAGNISNEVRDFIFGSEIGNTIYDQTTFEALASGDVTEMPAGPMQAAIGVQYRTDEIIDTPGETTRANNIYLSSQAGITKGDDSTSAIFGEVILPLVEGVTGIEYLELKVSARYTDVSSYGDDTTYKVGLNWKVVDSFRVRASRGTSFRSPALFELFLADQTSSIRQSLVDPCINWGTGLDTGAVTQTQADNCAAEGFEDNYGGAAISATVIAGGGFGILEAETSLSQTAGVVWTPEFADLAVSLDYFDIQIENEVTQLGASVIVNECYNSEFYPTDPLCDQFERDPLDRKIDNVEDSFINIATQVNRGWDMNVNYSTDLDFGKLRLETRHTYQERDSTALFPGTVRDTNGEFGDPQLTATFTAGLETDNWTYTWVTNYIGSVSNVERDNGDTIIYRGETVKVVNSADAVMYHSFSASHDFDTGLTALVGVANLLDERPPQVTTIGTSVQNQGDSAFYSQFDWRGRRLFVNLSYNF